MLAVRSCVCTVWTLKIGTQPLKGIGFVDRVSDDRIHILHQGHVSTILEATPAQILCHDRGDPGLEQVYSIEQASDAKRELLDRNLVLRRTPRESESVHQRMPPNRDEVTPVPPVQHADLLLAVVTEPDAPA
jgi:hypothetical protein